MLIGAGGTIYGDGDPWPLIVLGSGFLILALVLSVNERIRYARERATRPTMLSSEQLLGPTPGSSTHQSPRSGNRGPQAETARRLRRRGYDLYRTGSVVEALTVTAGAEDMALAAGDLDNVIDILALRSAAQWHLGDLASCQATAERFLRHCQAAPSERATAHAIRVLGELTIMRRSYRDAWLLLAESRSIAMRHRDVRLLVRTTLSEARLHLFGGHLLRARRRAAGVRREAGRTGMRGEQAEAGAVARAALLGLLFPPLRYHHRRHPRTRLTAVPVGVDRPTAAPDG